MKMNNRKGIILSGGAGTRLNPITISISKQLVPVYDKPMIYYSLSVLMMAGIKEILIITTPQDEKNFKRLLSNGRKFGLDITYKTQSSPNGIAEALIIGEDFLNGSSCALVLGDNIFIGNKLKIILNKMKNNNSSTIFAYKSLEPQNYGVINFNKENKATSIEEKPRKPKSNYIVTGLYFYDNQCCKIAKQLTPSKRGELEITDVNSNYLKQNNLHVEFLDNGISWYDAGTIEDLFRVSRVIRYLQKRKNKIIGSPEMTAFENGWIDKNQLNELIYNMKNSLYGQILNKINIDYENN